MTDPVLDFPTAWAIQNRGGLEHHPRCSSVSGWHPLSGPALLCDCGAVRREWERQRALRAPAPVADMPGWPLTIRTQYRCHHCGPCLVDVDGCCKWCGAEALTWKPAPPVADREKGDGRG